MQWFVRYAFRSPEQAADPRIALIKHPNLSDLAPATILLAQIDPMRSEGELFAQKLQDAGGHCPRGLRARLAHGGPDMVRGTIFC